MKKRNLLTMAVALVILMAAASFAAAGNFGQGHGKSGPGKHGHGPFKFLKKLDLTEAQKAQVKTILEKQQEAFLQNTEGRMDARAALGEAIHGSTFDEAAIRSAHKAVAAYGEEMAVLRAKTLNEIRSILTPEQIAKLEEKRERRRERIEERMEHRQERMEEWLDSQGE